MNEITDQYVWSLGIDFPLDFKQPYNYEDYQAMIYLFNAPFQSTYLEKQNWYGGKPPTNIIDPPWTPPKPPIIIPPLKLCPDTVTITCPDNVALGGTYQFVVPTGSPDSLYQWIIFPSSRMKGKINKDTGLYNAPSGNASCSSPVTINLQCAEKYVEGEPDWKTIATCTFTVGKPACTGTISIAYPILTMSVDEEMDLSATGLENGICGTSTFTWEIISGGGSLYPLTGGGTTYTAPSDNTSCLENPTIQLSCNNEIMDEITIGINEGTGKAFEIKYCHEEFHTHPNTNPPYYTTEHCAIVWIYYGSCNGVEVYEKQCGAGTSDGVPGFCASISRGSCVDAALAYTFAPDCAYLGVHPSALNVYYDVRTPAQILAGCCPGQLT
jgi:hypothetical protein